MRFIVKFNVTLKKRPLLKTFNNVFNQKKSTFTRYLNKKRNKLKDYV